MKINKTSYEVWTYRDTNAVNMCVLTRNPTRQSVCSFSSFINLQEFDYYSWFFPIKYDTEQLLYLGIEWIDTGNKGSSEYTKGMLVTVQYIFMINARTRNFFVQNSWFNFYSVLWITVLLKTNNVQSRRCDRNGNKNET